MTRPRDERATACTSGSASLFDRSAWRYFYSYFRPERARLLVYAVIASAQSLIVLPVLILIRYAFDTAIPKAQIALLL
jgi:hypothetical protein